jgi:integrase
VADLAATDLAPSTVRKTYHLLGKVLAAAVDAGMIAQSPCQRVPLPKVEREEMRFLTPPEIARLADAIRPSYRALVLVGAYGGLRIGELAGLRRSRVDLLRGTVVALWIAAGANPKEVAARAGHTSVSFTLDRYGHLYPESDAALLDRLDAIYTAGQRDQDAAVVDLFQERSQAPAPSQNTGDAAGTGPVTVVTSMALLTGEDHQGLATASTLRWGLLLSEP